jgi:Flp pilus assembly protein TadG
VKRKQRGGMFILGALIILPLMGFAVLAIDVGRVFIVRNELQNVADAAALAGANCLTRQSDPVSATDCLATESSTLNWARAAARAQAQLSSNAADNLSMSSSGVGSDIQVGYWNLCPASAGCPAGKSGVPSGGSFSTAFSPVTAFDKPAVSVEVTKAAGMNNGPIAMLTQRIFNVGADVPMSARAVAVISSPNVVFPGSLIPQAINKCLFDLYWDTSTNSPKLATTTELNGVPQTIGQPWRLRIGSSYHYGTCDSGQWTTFDRDANSAAEVKDLITSGNPNSLSIGDMTWIKPGTANSGYNELDGKFPTPPGADVTVVVVDYPDLSHLDPTTGRQLEIVAFAGFRITDIKGGSDKYMEGHFIPSTVTAGGGIGPFYGSYTPPRIAQ